MEQAQPTDLAAIGRMAQAELQDLLRQRREMNKRIEVLRKTVRALLAGGHGTMSREYAAVRMSPRKREGLTDVCREILKHSPQPLTRHEVAERVRNLHAAEAARHRNLPAAISGVLRHLLESGEANNAFNEAGHRTWFAVSRRQTV